MYQEVVVGVVAHHLLAVDLVEGHTTLHTLVDGVAVFIGEYALCAHEIV